MVSLTSVIDSRKSQIEERTLTAATVFPIGKKVLKGIYKKYQNIFRQHRKNMS